MSIAKVGGPQISTSGIECTTYINPEHSKLECTMRTHCALCHSKAHMIDQCEYNLLTVPISQIEHEMTSRREMTDSEETSDSSRMTTRRITETGNNRDYSQCYGREPRTDRRKESSKL